ncbi:MAG TPA: HAMP domain-containing sensor histidine kinase [Jiangellaceae bacterium]
MSKLRELLDRAPVARVRESVRRMPLRRRIGVLAALGVGLAVLITAMAAYWTVRVQLTQSVDEDLLARAYAAVPGPLGNPSELDRLTPDPFIAAGLRVALVRSDGVTTFPRGHAPPLGEHELAVAQGSSEQSVRTTLLEGESFRVVAVPAASDFALVLAQSTATVDRVLDQLGLVSVIAGGVGIGLASWAGASIARAGLRPVERLTAVAEHVAATGELDPIEVRGDDEIARLTHAFNAMLSALDEARTRQRRLVADAGHELRTPLTSLRTNLDLLAQSDREGGLDGAERAELIDDVSAQITELSTLVTDLMELSREDAPQTDLQSIDLADVVGDALSRVRRRAPHITFSADLRPWLLEGDAQLLGRAATNLLDNAAKWSPPGGTVWVSLRDGVLEVDDEGPGIAEDDMPHVFERFYRSSEARGRPGSGLGLAIVRTAAQRHGGQVTASRAPTGGARLTMSLPGHNSSSALV